MITTMKIVYNPSSNLKLLQYGIQIPVTDFRDELIAEAMSSKEIPVEVIKQKLNQLSLDDLTRVHQSSFIERLQSESSLIEEIMTCFELINPDGSYNRYDPSRATAPITELYECVIQKIETAYYASQYCLKGENAFLLGGGFHHAMSFGGRGFCLLNDGVIVLEKLRSLNKIKNAWIIDVDAHKGDGSAELTANNPYISTLSIHMKNGWPLVTGPLDSDKKLYPWYIPSTIDIEMEMGQEAQYMHRLQRGLEQLKAATAKPDMAIIVLGADPYELDELPSSSKLNLTLPQMLQRDQLVAEFLAKEGIPALYLMGGGYGVHSHEPYVQFLNKVFDK